MNNKIIIGEKEYDSITVTTTDGELLADISAENIIEIEGVTVTLVRSA